MISQIQEQYKIWQPIIKKELGESAKLYHYVWGEHFQEDGWYNEELKSSDKFLFQKASIIQKQHIGSFVFYNDYSLSGDWSIATEYYFDTSHKLYFVYWRMNTFQATEPLTVEKRLYFDASGTLIQSQKSKYKINTIEESTAEFTDREVEYNLQLEKMRFYKKWSEK